MAVPENELPPIRGLGATSTSMTGSSYAAKAVLAGTRETSAATAAAAASFKVNKGASEKGKKERRAKGTGKTEFVSAYNQLAIVSIHGHV